MASRLPNFFCILIVTTAEMDSATMMGAIIAEMTEVATERFNSELKKTPT